MKKIVAIALALVMLLSLSVSAWADNVDTDDLVKQLTLIKNSFNTLKQSDNPTVWYYAVTDLDHNGRVELLAAPPRTTARTTPSSRPGRSARTATPSRPSSSPSTWIRTAP